MKQRNRERLARAEKRAEFYEQMAEHLAAQCKLAATLLTPGLPMPIRPEEARTIVWTAYKNWSDGEVP